MKIIIPVAGRGTRVRPQTFAKPKPFLPLAGKLAIDFILDPILKLNPEEIIIIHDQKCEDTVKEIFPKRYPHQKFQFTLQKNALGTGHATYQAKEFIKEGDEILIVYSDMLFSKDLTCIHELSKKADSVLFCLEVQDPQHYGVLYHVNNRVTALIEKPKEPKSNLANMGIYYLKDGYTFMNRYVKRVIDNGPNQSGEYYLTDAFSYMLQDGAIILAEPLDKLLDTGTIKKLIHANKILLKGSSVKGENVIIENSTIGENVSIGDNTTITNANIENAIIGSNVTIDGLEIKDSIIGDKVIIKKEAKRYNLGDYTQIK
jgi:glucose-1-phosphate thymidylyltransferase